MTTESHEILISGYELKSLIKYEFIINNSLQVTSFTCKSHNARIGICRKLFELDHIRVNPSLDNKCIINRLLLAFKEINASVINTPNANSISTCFRPLGQIKSKIRFYINENAKMTFLCPDAKPRLVSSKKFDL